jgi:uncharacterized protein (TIGR02266 family)
MPVRLQVPNLASFFESETVNISAGGMFIATEDLPPVGTQLDVEVVLEDGQLVLHATVEVVRHQANEAPIGVGARFVEISYEAQALIDRMVADEGMFGNYKIERLIGQGAMAEVYLARHLAGNQVGRPVALKRIRPELSADDDVVAFFVREAEISRKLSHPNIVDVLEVGRIDNTCFIAMDYIKGCNLAQILRACRSRDILLPTDFSLFVCHQVAIALEYAHTLCDESGEPLGIIHRDVAPTNVFISDGGEIKLGDFGVAHIAAAGRQARKMVAGKDPYIAPEQLKGRGVSPASDVFSLGAILYEMLTNQVAFSAPTPAAIHERIAAARVTPTTELRPEVSAELDQVVMTAISPRSRASESLLEKTFRRMYPGKYRHRYESAGAFGHALAPLYDPAQGTQLAIAAVVRNLGLG